MCTACKVNAVEQRIGRTATAHEICTSLGLSQKEYFKRVEEAKPIRILALDGVSEHSEGSGTSLYNLLADTNDETGREQLEKAELLEMLAQHLARLPEMQRKILSMYYFENLRFSAIAAAFNLTESRISQIHQATIQGLRKWIKAARER
jgi:RNA polymerase sigma factor for flagellar operon FliA